MRGPASDGMCLGAPGEIRTPDLTLRRRSLYPAELRARSFSIPHFGLRWRIQRAVPDWLLASCRLTRISSITDWIRALAPSMPASTACRSRAGLLGFRVEAQ